MTWPNVPLANVLSPVSRPVIVDATVTYRLLGAHWYAQGLYIKDTLCGSQIRANRVYRVESGDFVYNRLFAWKGSFAVATGDVADCFVSNEFPSFRVDESRLDAQFLWRYLGRATAWTDALGLSAGGTPTSRNRLKEDKFLGMLIPLPPLAEQRRIVAKIDQLAAKIAEARKLREQIVMQLAALITAYHFHAAEKDVLLRDILELHEEPVAVESHRQYPQIGIRGFGGGLFGKPAVQGAATTYKRFNRLYPDAIVLSQVKGWEGAIGVCPPELSAHFASPEYRTFRCRGARSRPDYLDAVLRTPWFLSLLSGVTRGVGARRERTRPEHFLALRVPMPSLERQSNFVHVLRRLNEIKALQAQAAAELDALLPAILDRAFRGEL